MTEQKYIEHEVQLRVLKETTESKFYSLQKNMDDKFLLMLDKVNDKVSFIDKLISNRFKQINFKLNIVLGMSITSLLMLFFKIVLEII